VDSGQVTIIQNQAFFTGFSPEHAINEFGQFFIFIRTNKERFLQRRKYFTSDGCPGDNTQRALSALDDVAEVGLTGPHGIHLSPAFSMVR
jgi:hypothetical protein